MLAGVALALSAPRHAFAQDTTSGRFALDKLQIVSVGGSVGRIGPSEVEPTIVYAVQADYGEIMPGWHVVVGTSFWDSRFRDAVVQTFVDSLQKSLTDSSARVMASRVTVFDITFSGDLRYVATYGGVLKPFFGVGIAAHVINADGKLIDGTFAERAFDDIATGLFVTTGAALRLVGNFGIEASARADLLSTFRSAQVRAGATYYFGNYHGTRTPGTGSKDHSP